VRQFVLAIIVGLLTFSASGLPTLIAGEPCTGYEQPGSEDARARPHASPAVAARRPLKLP
jgi:hypothetical protein